MAPGSVVRAHLVLPLRALSVEELTLSLGSWGTQESRCCTLPGQHRGIDLGGRLAGEPAPRARIRESWSPPPVCHEVVWWLNMGCLTSWALTTCGGQKNQPVSLARGLREGKQALHLI